MKTPLCAHAQSRSLSMGKRLVVVLVLTGTSPCLVAAQDRTLEIGALTCVLGEPSSAPPGEVSTGGGETREVLCRFQPKNGADEEYAGTVEGLSVSAPDHKRTLIWLVRQASEAPLQPGISSRATKATSPDASNKPPLVGRSNPQIFLHTMTDAGEGSATVSEKPPPTGFIVVALVLELKSASG